MFKNYIKIAFRNLQKNKVFSLINIAGLTIGLTAFWLIALYVADELSFDRYHENAKRIYRVAQHASWNGGKFDFPITSDPFASALKNDFPQIQETARFDIEGGGTISYNNKHLQVNDIMFTDPSAFTVFSWHFLSGNPKTALAKPQSIVLTKSLATKIFGNPSSALNKTISFDQNNSNLVTGVIDDVPPNSHFSFSALRALPADNTQNWQNSHLYTYILLKPNAKIETVEAGLPQFFSKYLKANMSNVNYRMELQPLTSIHLHSNLSFEMGANSSITYIYTFSVVAILILLIAAINYMNLSTARSSIRMKEIGVRKVTGSSKTQLVWMFLSESVLLTFIASVAAVFLISLIFPWFTQLTSKALSIWRFGRIETILLLSSFSLCAGIISGIYPALFFSRFKTISALKGKLGSQNSNQLFRKALVTFQFVITIAMIAGSVVIYQQLQYVSKKDLGFNKDQVLTFHIQNQEVRKQISALKQQLLQNPLIQSVAAASNPIGNNDIGKTGYLLELNGKMETKSRIGDRLMIDEDYIPTMQIKLLQGRNFLQNMPTDKTQGLIVNETFVKDAGWKNAIGRKIQYNTDEKGKPLVYQIIGVIKDFHIFSLQHKIEPLLLQLPPATNDEDNLYVRVQKNSVKEALHYIGITYKKFDQENPLDYHFLDQNFARQYQSEQKQSNILLIFTVLTILIACLGLFGLVTFMAQQRTKEIGIRKVLGASVTQITSLLSQDFMKLVVLALMIASPIAFFTMQKWLQDFAYRIQISWWVFAFSGLLAIVIALITISFQAIRAALANPVKSLRSE